MDIYSVIGMGDLIRGNPYVGRGIVAGVTPDGKKTAVAYFIMGRSENSRNRVFIEEGDDLRTAPYDPAKVKDPSLIIYYPVRTVGGKLIVTNGDQTDTIRDGLAEGKTFSAALRTRKFEPDAPNFTPRISAIIDLDGSSYEMSILKSADAEGTACNRFTFDYSPLPGLGHFIHTYVTDGNPIPTFRGEPERVLIPQNIDEFTKDVWENLDGNNRISLYVRYTDIATGEYEKRLINKYVKE